MPVEDPHKTSALDYFVVDVFTRSALAGNPLAVVIDTVGLATERMQSIAREFNLSETTFVQRRARAVEQAEGVRVRIFTTQQELPFAGHPTLGTASVLKRTAPEVLRGNTLTLALTVGTIPVRFQDGCGDSATTFGEMTQPNPEFGAKLDRQEVAPLLGMALDDLGPMQPQLVSTGNVFAIVLLQSVQTLARLELKQQEATEWLRARGGRWFYVMAPSGETEPRFRARMQFDGGEDPATGSAAGCAISYLVAQGLVPSGERILVRQGVEIRRPSDLYLSAKIDSRARVSDVRVGGSTVLVATGHLFLP